LCYDKSSLWETIAMRFAVPVLLLLFAAPAFAAAPPALPPGAAARDAALMAKIGPESRVWIAGEANHEAAQPVVSEASAVSAVRMSPLFAGLSDGDIEALAFLVMMEASQSSEQDLNQIMQGVKAIDNAKAAARQKAASTSQVSPAAKIPPTAIKHLAIQSPPHPRPDLDAAIAHSKDSLDSLNELGETESLRLQMAMDRRSKFMTALSNLMKKMSDTDSAITQNLK
jgi:hypothetical protein